jgi:hypothetical protein
VHETQQRRQAGLKSIRSTTHQTFSLARRHIRELVRERATHPDTRLTAATGRPHTEAAAPDSHRLPKPLPPAKSAKLPPLPNAPRRHRPRCSRPLVAISRHRSHRRETKRKRVLACGCPEGGPRAPSAVRSPRPSPSPHATGGRQATETHSPCEAAALAKAATARVSDPCCRRTAALCRCAYIDQRRHSNPTTAPTRAPPRRASCAMCYRAHSTQGVKGRRVYIHACKSNAQPHALATSDGGALLPPGPPPFFFFLR